MKIVNVQNISMEEKTLDGCRFIDCENFVL